MLSTENKAYRVILFEYDHDALPIEYIAKAPDASIAWSEASKWYPHGKIESVIPVEELPN